MNAGKVLLTQLTLLLCMSASSAGYGQPVYSTAKEFPLWAFDEIGESCHAKGRLQDKEYCNSKLMDRIIALGKDLFPY